jgi:hypothetical protein
MASVVTDPPITAHFEQVIGHLDAAGRLFPFDYRFREGAESGRALALTR